ncbi:MAG: hypothetical protein Q8J69_04380 [Sphingobacteriaceae bacterium]|nr:hypothetical protein [Sphingobacteriaceae bacterium]
MSKTIKILTSTSFLLMITYATIAQSFDAKVKMGKDHYVVLRPGTDTIYGKITEIAHGESGITKLRITSRGKSKTFSKEELRNVIGYRMGNFAQEFAFIPTENQKKEGRWLQVFNTGEVRLLQTIENTVFKGEEVDYEVNYKMYYWRVGDGVFPIHESLLAEAIVPSINGCLGQELVKLGSAGDKEYLLQLTKYWNAHFDCIYIIDLN